MCYQNGFKQCLQRSKGNGENDYLVLWLGFFFPGPTEIGRKKFLGKYFIIT